MTTLLESDRQMVTRLRKELALLPVKEKEMADAVIARLEELVENEAAFVRVMETVGGAQCLALQQLEAARLAVEKLRFSLGKDT
jgi:hypothetical protein